MPGPKTTCPRGHSYIVEPGANGGCPICGATTAPGDATTVADFPVRNDAPVTSSEEPQAQHAGPFRIVREHARGGLGRVSVAVDEALRREVAVKQMRPEAAESFSSRMRFVSEAVVTGQLEHPGIVPVYAFGLDSEGLPYYAMRFVHGRTFDVAIREYHAKPDRLVFRDLLRRFVSVCQAIAYAHSRRVIHRDIKPQNIMLGEYGETLILDWGLAKQLDGTGEAGAVAPSQADVKLDDASGASGSGTVGSGPALTVDGSALGTPGYMAPEQASGDAARAGPPADVYSLGATLMHLLDGRPPPPKVSPDTALDEVTKRAPKPLVAVCRRAMSKRPANRYASADELAREVDRWLADEPVLAFREPITARVTRWARRHRTAAIAGAVVLAVAVVALTVTNVLVGRQKRVADQQRGIAVEERGRAELQLAHSLVAQGNMLMETGRLELARTRLDEAFASLTKLGAPTMTVDLSLGHLFGRTPPPVNPLSYVRVAGLSGVAFAPDGRTILVSGGDKARGATLVKLDTATGRATEHRPAGFESRRSTALALSPDGKTLAFATDGGGVNLCDAKTMRPLDTALAAPATATTFSASPTTTAILTATRPIQSIATARVLCFSPDSTLLVAARDDGTASIWRTADGALSQSFDAAPFGALPGPRVGAHSLSFSRDRVYLLVGGRDLVAMLFDMRTGLPCASLGPHLGLINAAALSGDAKLAVTATDDQFVHVYNVDADRIDHTLRGLAAPVTSVALAPDGLSAAAADVDRKIMTWSTQDTSPHRMFPGAPFHAGVIRHLRYSPDGRLLLTASDDGALCVWDAGLAQQARSIGVATLAMPSFLSQFVSGSDTRAVGLVVAISRDGRLGLRASEKEATLFDVATTRTLKTFTQGRGRPARLAFRADGREALVVGPGATARVDDLSASAGRAATTNPVASARTFESSDKAELTAGAIGPDGTMFLGDERGRLYVVPDDAPASARRLDDGNGARVNDLAVSEDGKRLLSSRGDSGAIELWDVAQRRITSTLAGHRGAALAVAFGGAGSALSGGADGTVRVWNIARGELTATLLGHTGAVNAVALSPAAGMAVSGGADRSMKVWDLNTMTETHTYISHLAPVCSVALDAPGRFAITGINDGLGAIWDLGFVPAYRAFDPRLGDAFRDASDSATPDAATLATLGRWYAFRGQFDWAGDLLAAAREAGAKDVSSLMLARCHWQAGELVEARAQFERAIRETEAPETYVRLCIRAIDEKQP